MCSLALWLLNGLLFLSFNVQMDVEVSQRPDPLLNGFSAVEGLNNDAAQSTNTADAGVLIDFDPMSSPAAAVGCTSGKADTTGELLLDSFDPIEPSMAPKDADPVGLVGSSGVDDTATNDIFGAVTNVEDPPSLVEPAGHHVVVVPDDVLAAPPPTREDDIEEPKVATQPLVSGDAVTEVTSASTKLSEPPSPVTANDDTKSKVKEPAKPKLEERCALPEPSAKGSAEKAKSKPAANKSAALAPKESSAGGPTMSTTKKTTPTAGVAKSTPTPRGSRPSSAVSSSAAVKRPTSVTRTSAGVAAGSTEARNSSPMRARKPVQATTTSKGNVLRFCLYTLWCTPWTR